jgi:hypothetical protein
VISGVLNDWDLSVIAGESPDVGEHTATIPFLSTNLLKDEYWNGQLEVLYWHDLESFVWTITWVFLYYDNRKEMVMKALARWQTGDYVQCRKEKYDFLCELLPGDPSPTPSWTNKWHIALPLLRRLKMCLVMRDMAGPEAGEKEVLAEFLTVLEDVGKEHPMLRYLCNLKW